MNQHKPDCGINISCAVYHADGICNHPKYGKCTCGAISPTPLTGIIEEYVKTFIASYRLLSKNGMVPSDREVESYMRNFITTLTTQHTKEKEELVKSILNVVHTHDESDDSRGECDADYLYCRSGCVEDAYKRIERVIKNHNITI